MKILIALLLPIGFMSQVGYASTDCGSMSTKRIHASTNPPSKKKAKSKRPAPRTQTTQSSSTQR